MNRPSLTEPRTDTVRASIYACSVCRDTGVIHMEGRTLPCPYSRPDDACLAAGLGDLAAVPS